MFRLIIRNLTFLIPNHTNPQNVYRIQQSIINSVRLLQTLAVESNNDPNTCDSKNQHFTTISYFKNNCGLSLDSAVSASKRVTITSTHNADSVLQLFKSYNFTPPQITNLLTRCPSLIQSDSDQFLKPKLEYLESLGLSKPELAKLFSSDKCPSFIRSEPMKMEANVLTLRSHGVPDSSISKFLMMRPVAMVVRNDVFRGKVGRVEEMGFCSRSLAFIRALQVVISVNEMVWEKKVDLLKSFGWSYDDVVVAFRLQSRFMACSEKKIRVMMEFYLNKLGFKASDVARCPALLMLSLEKSVIRRSSVLHVLSSMGLISELNLASALCANKKQFERMFLNKYGETVPEIMSVYQGDKKLLNDAFDTLAGVGKT